MAENSTPLLRVEHLGMQYHTPQGETTALRDVNFTMEKGEFLSIVGPSGCGKTTILSLIAGLLTPSQGQIFINQQPVQGINAALVGYMLQHDHLFPWRSVWQNIRLGLELKGSISPEQEKYLWELLNQYGLSEFAHSSPKHLSGGMRQRVALIRTLAAAPELLLLDEPFSALDYQTRINVSDDIAHIIRNQGKTAILVTHDLSEAISLSDRVLVLTPRPGQISAVLDIDLPGDHVVEKRQSGKFSTYFDFLWKELNSYEQA